MRPRTALPAKGVALPRERKSAGSTVQAASGSMTVDDHEVGGGAGEQAARQAERPARPCGQRLDDALEGDLAGQDEVGVDDGEGRLQADDAHRAPGQAAGFLLGAVGRVVGGDGVDGAVAQALDERLAVFCAAQRGIHLEAAVLLEVVLAEGQVVGTGLAGHAHAARLGLADQLHALGAGDVADVVAAARLLAEEQVPLDLAPFALGADPFMAMRGAVASVVERRLRGRPPPSRCASSRRAGRRCRRRRRRRSGP